MKLKNIIYIGLQYNMLNKSFLDLKLVHMYHYYYKKIYNKYLVFILR